MQSSACSGIGLHLEISSCLSCTLIFNSHGQCLFHLAIYASSLSKKARRSLPYWKQNRIRLSKLNVAAKFNVIDRKCVTLVVMKGRVLLEMFSHPALMKFQQLVKAKHICTNLHNLVHFKSKRL